MTTESLTMAARVLASEPSCESIACAKGKVKCSVKVVARVDLVCCHGLPQANICQAALNRVKKFLMDPASVCAYCLERGGACKLDTLHHCWRWWLI